MLADAIAGGGGRGSLPLPAAQRKKGVPNPIADGPDAGDRFTGMGIHRLEQLGHCGQGFRSAHLGARPENLAATVLLVPPKRDPVPAASRLAFLETAALKAPAAHRRAIGKDDVVHGPGTLASGWGTIQSSGADPRRGKRHMRRRDAAQWDGPEGDGKLG